MPELHPLAAKRNPDMSPTADRRILKLQTYLTGLERFGMKPGLGRVRHLLACCGNPHESLACIHVAGTNGKGSVCALVESILRAAGYATGLYTSPHLVSFIERIRIDGRGTGGDMLAGCAAELIPHADSMASMPGGMPTYFEFMTALALLCFRRQGVDYAILEAGMGGRLDATNIVSAALVAITSIGLEHQEQLGDTPGAIAAEKAAIIKEGAWVVCGELEREAREVVEKRCREKLATLRQIGSDILYRLRQQSPGGSVLSVRGCGTYKDLVLPLAGRHQLTNCAVALGLIEGVRKQGADIPQQAVREGIASVQWPGRLQLISSGPRFIADCAHNPQAARAVARALGELYPGRKWIVILGILRDKDIRGISEALMPLASAVVAVRVPSPRSADPRAIAAACRGAVPVMVTEELGQALGQARGMVSRYAAEGIFLTGSTYLVGEMMRMAQERVTS